MTLTTQFLYDMNNLSLYQPQLAHVAIALVIGSIALVVCRYLFLYHIGFFIVWHEKRVIQSKKHILGDLILMKDIQSELEKDIERASLKATFQS